MCRRHDDRLGVVSKRRLAAAFAYTTAPVSPIEKTGSVHSERNDEKKRSSGVFGRSLGALRDRCYRAYVM
ncbi:hypothetical protein [Halorubrum laminariae]|uniref:hypothetical protein n=1 Tax=Halorubrum laminariae TaxID=1433523 RepID=UPI0021129993|nr:hypothetical protein [Halorubrum laminariae]